jgi:hypothetical protein
MTMLGVVAPKSFQLSEKAKHNGTKKATAKYFIIATSSFIVIMLISEVMVRG